MHKFSKSNKMLLNIVYFLVGLGLIIKGADWLTDGASSIARRFHVSSLVIGLTIVAFGTSAPELVVSLISGIEGKSDIAIGNVVGSNIFNTLAICGITALICPILCQRSTLHFDLPICVLASLMLYVLASDSYLFGSSTNIISRIDGVILLLMFSVFLYHSFRSGKSSNSSNGKVENEGSSSSSLSSESDSSSNEMSLFKSILLFFIGLGCLIFGGEWFVDGASGIASTLGVSQSTIALTIVAAGTSFPELVTSIVAARKGDTDMALGNVIGSNIFNIFMILGVSSLIQPLELGTVGPINLLVLIVSSLMMYMFGILGSRKRYITRSEGLSLTIMAICYYSYVVIVSG